MIVLTRKEKADLTRTEEYIRQRIERTLQGIRSIDITFLDEVYRLIDARVESLDYLAEVRVPIVDDYTPVESTLYNTMATDIRELSEINLETIKDVYDSLGEVYNDIYSEGETISNSLTVCEELLTKVESTLKGKMKLSSVKDEVAVVAIGESIGTASEEIFPTLPSLLEEDEGGSKEAGTAVENMIAGISSSPTSISTLAGIEDITPVLGEGLNVDQNGGYVTLSISERTRLDYTVKAATFTKPKGKINPPRTLSRGEAATTIFGPSILRSSMALFTDGYFNSRTFSSEPIFENQFSSSTETISDGSLDTEYLAEYSSARQTTFGMTLTLDVTDSSSRPRRVDGIDIELSTGDKSSIRSTSVPLPKLTRLVVDQRDMTSRVLNNTVYSNGVMITGSNPRGFKSVPLTPNPVGSFLVDGKPASTIAITLTADVPQLIYFPEKRLLNSAGGIIRKMNYFETLILNEYEPQDGFPTPADLYTSSEINSLWDAVESAYSSVDIEVPLYRYFVALKDISVYSMSYETSGMIASGNLNMTPEKRVAAVELFTNEIRPTGTGINYYISSDKNKWYPISPLGRSNPTAIPTRIVYSNITKQAKDNFIGVNSSSVFLKIEMTGDGTITPILKGYSTRIKYV